MPVFVDVQGEATNDAKVGKLLDLLERCGLNAFDGFVKALNEKGQEDAATVLTDAVNTNDSRAVDGMLIFSSMLNSIWVRKHRWNGQDMFCGMTNYFVKHVEGRMV